MSSYHKYSILLKKYMYLNLPFHTKAYSQCSYFLFSNTCKIVTFKWITQNLVKMHGWGET